MSNLTFLQYIFSLFSKIYAFTSNIIILLLEIRSTSPSRQTELYRQHLVCLCMLSTFYKECIVRQSLLALLLVYSCGYKVCYHSGRIPCTPHHGGPHAVPSTHVDYPGLRDLHLLFQMSKTLPTYLFGSLSHLQDLAQK